MAWASIAVPAWSMIWFLVNEAISRAMSVSRMRDSEADRFSTDTSRFLIVCSRRFWVAPRLPRVVETDEMAVSSAVIAPDGHEISRTQFFTPAYLDAQVRLKTAQTPATRWGPAVQWALVSAAVAVLVAAMLHNGWFMRPLRRRRHRTESPPERGGPTSARAERHDEGAS